MAALLGLQIGYFNPILNDNLKSVIIPDGGEVPAFHFRLRVRLHYCTTESAESIALVVKDPMPSSNYDSSAGIDGMQYCLPKRCAPISLQ